MYFSIAAPARRNVLPRRRGSAMFARTVERVFILIVLTGLLLAQRADRATVTGVVSDQTGNYVAGATVKVRNDDTGVETVLTTNHPGAYTSPLLSLSPYPASANHAGF